NERQFHTLFEKAGKMKGVHGETFLILLDSRLDNLVYRAGFARTRRQSRQLVNHGHITVDGKRVDIACYSVKPGQVIGIRDQARNMDVIKEALEVNKFTPDYLTADAANMEATFKSTHYPADISTVI